MTTALKAENLYHTGIVVPDLDAATARFSAMAGYSFTRPIEGPVTIRTDTGEQTVELRFVYSMQAPHVELIQQVPGTPWSAAAAHAVHHLGYFTEDFAATAEALQADGFTLELCPAGDSDAPSIFAYYLSPDGIRIEIVDRNVFGDLDGFLKAFR